MHKDGEYRGSETILAPDQMLKKADFVQQQIQSQPKNIQREQLERLRANNPALYSMVKDKLDV